MDELDRLRKRVSGVKVNAQGRRAYGRKLRGELIAFTRGEMGTGRSITQTAKQLGLNPATLVNWLHAEVMHAANSMRPVETVPDEMTRTAEPTALPCAIVLELSSGARVLGLGLEQIIEIVRRL
jgi:hypothetical protein